ncbi:hypothetical protein [Actinoallomurus iriomotensis]|uniref:Secreted protein n=1 Tax=Actinoallomurus iriomotensis TaxID=478107 RepID=A0A9W6SDM2_9ACTN|nr:hypothetical protein [Actinoallomurus iriomotensis]GLY90312.1 hypothetical protein Airi02_082410 [Actinoallomurus iriomotensis]
MTFMDQLPTLAGVIVGAVGSYAASSLTERARWRRAHAERWDQPRFQAYASYANLLKAQLRISLRIGAARGFDHVVDPLDPDEGLQRLAEAESRRAAEWESMLLVGDASTVAAARTWHEAVWAVESYARGLKDDPAGWEGALRRASQARDAFYRHARRDLGIEGPPPPSGNWPRSWADEPA